MLIIVSPFVKSFDDEWFTYIVPKELEEYIKLGIVVDVPLQTQVVSWVVLDIQKEENLVFDTDKLKNIVAIKYETPLLYDYQINILKWISKYYFCKIHSSLNLYFPRNLKEKIEKIKLDLNTKKELNYIFNYQKNLTKNQEKVFNQIEKIEKNIIFYWVTWSGKTEVYVNLVKKYLDMWKQSLILLPEIILNNQIFGRFKEIFWEDVIIINSSITETSKYKNRVDIYNNNAKIIIWTRSSLFYPYRDLWLVIIDEEHDPSYKSDNSPKVDIREIVLKMKEFIDFKLIFASWTPSIKTIYKWLTKEFEIVNLLDEYEK